MNFKIFNNLRFEDFLMILELILIEKAIFFEYALLCKFCPLIYHVFVEVVFSGIESKIDNCKVSRILFKFFS